MTKIEITHIDHNLLADIDNQTQGWELFEAPYEQATVSNQRYQVVFSEEAGRAGIVFCGSGSSGATSWTDAVSPDDAIRRYLADEMAN